MKGVWSILIGLAVLTVGIAPGSNLASDRNGTVWAKQTNFNNPQPRRAIVNIAKKKKPTQIARASSTRKESEPPANRVLATFDLDEDAVALIPPEEPVTKVKPTPGKCEWVRSIVTAYAFEDVTPKVCTGSVFTYEAHRGDRTFLIQASALYGDLIKVERTDAPQDVTTVTIEPASQ
jgi:hypothetical protein